MATSSNNSRITDENAIPERLRAKITQVRPQETRRAALSAITDNVPKLQRPTQKTFGKTAQTTYQQPVRTAHTKPSFSVYEDATASTSAAPEAQKICLPKEITALYREQCVFPKYEPNIEDSPMVLDLSCYETLGPIVSDLVFQMHPYQSDIYAHLKELELKHRPKPTYMRKQPDINSSMRSVLVDWLIEVQDSYKMETSTLHFAVSYLDRFLSHMSVLRAKLQLVGTTGLFIASKYEEIYPPDIKEFVYVTDKTYEASQIRRMEQLMLKVLSFNLSAPTAYDFLQYYASMASVTSELRALAEFICEISLLEDAPYLEYLPSTIAAASLCLANHVAGSDDPWSEKLVAISGYLRSDLHRCIQNLWESYRSLCNKPFAAVGLKYSFPKYYSVSKLPVPALDFHFEESDDIQVE